MKQSLILDIDLKHNLLTLEGYETVKLPKCKGLTILHFLNKYQNKQFSPTLLRMNIENKQDVEYYQQNEYSFLIQQACDYIPATDRQAIYEVIAEMRKNKAEMEKAQAMNDESLLEYLFDQNEQLNRYLSQTVSINQTIKNLNQAKTNNTKSIKRAMDNLLKYISKENQGVAEIISSHIVINSQVVCLYS